ncbi:MAG: M13-type metalloendopeptidase, partial [Propionicimonas sp.]
VNGRLTLGENIGDLGGEGIAYQAWQLAGGDFPTDTDADSRGAGHSDSQRFFLAYARAWQSKRRDAALRQQLATDPHSPEEFRCNQVVRNVEGFYEAFGVGPADAAWLPQERRVTIW